MTLPITPETKVGALLEAYPGIEETLIACVPAFVKLKNPVLRGTVAKVATLEQAARIGGVALPELVCTLRKAAGLVDVEAPCVKPSPRGCTGAAPPDWLDGSHIRLDIDADAMLKTGEHPIGLIRRRLGEAQAGDIIRLTSSFHPAPLIDALTRGGAAVYSAAVGPGVHITYICRRG
jgi:hypothetical protein